MEWLDEDRISGIRNNHGCDIIILFNLNWIFLFIVDLEVEICYIFIKHSIQNHDGNLVAR
jgi:hypothetical protein